MLAPIARQLFIREQVPQRVLWWLSAAAMADFYRMIARGLAPHLGGRDAARAVLSQLVAQTLRRRHEILARDHPGLPMSAGDRDVARLMAGLYRIDRHPKAEWVLAALGGVRRGLAERLAVTAGLRPLSIRQRWDEVSVHLGEVLITMTAELPKQGLGSRTNAIIGDICFEGGQAYGKRTKAALGLDRSPDSAIEVLRIGEYIFQVNPAHWSATDRQANTGYLEGSACLWYRRPGWQRLHCGIFGQFQSGISSVFGLKYRLSQTIPKRGGHTCRVDLTPIGAPRRR